MTENEKLRALLAEAHQALVDSGYDESIPVFRNITAALAEPVDSATDVVEPEPVEWKEDERWDDGRSAYYAKLAGRGELSVFSIDPEDRLWVWEVCIPGGMVNAADEAKAAAIQAAKEMR